jgi:hypothetical protein
VNDNLQAALDYAARGLRVIPIPRGEKAPRLPEWQKKATTDRETIRNWFGARPDANIGIATGAESGVFVWISMFRSTRTIVGTGPPRWPTWSGSMANCPLRLPASPAEADVTTISATHSASESGTRQTCCLELMFGVMAANVLRRRAFTRTGSRMHGQKVGRPANWISQRRPNGCWTEYGRLQRHRRPKRVRGCYPCRTTIVVTVPRPWRPNAARWQPPRKEPGMIR